MRQRYEYTYQKPGEDAATNYEEVSHWRPALVVWQAADGVPLLAQHRPTKM